ncbi:MAG TPA: cytochrome c-550 PedF [Hyphomicrobiaceae bacterium]|nr:cytochrome c-550 PedF [Hyphomicrobiaceae bacterium]
MVFLRTLTVACIIGVSLAASVSKVIAHGDVQPQPVDTTGLEQLGQDWRETNPYSGNEIAIKIGSSGYNQNCARCHGLQVISGGLAPDLRYLEKGQSGDEWFLQRIRHGATVNGITKMPAFEGILSQEAMWAIRAYIESQHDDS